MRRDTRAPEVVTVRFVTVRFVTVRFVTAWAALAGLAVWIVGLLRFRAWRANDDLAMFQVQLERLAGGDIPLVGAYSRLAFHHPGPVREWIFGAAYTVAGRRSAAIPATALTINVAFAVLACWLGWRAAGRRGALLAAAGAALIVVGLGWNVHSAWNPYLAVLASYAAAWAVIDCLTTTSITWWAGVVAASFAAHCHVVAAIPAVAAIAVIAVRIVLDVRAGRCGVGRLWRLLGSLAVLWSGPLLDLANGGESNLSRLLRASDEPGVGPSAAMRAVGRGLTPWSIGGGEALRSDGAMPVIASWLVVLAAAGMLALGMLAARVGARFERNVAATALAATVLAVVAVAAFVPPVLAYLLAPLTGGLVFASVATVAVLVLAAESRLAGARGAPEPSELPPEGEPIQRRPVLHAIAATTTVAALVLVAGLARLQPIATAELQRSIDQAVGSAVVAGRPYQIVGADLVASVAHGEVALAVERAGAIARSHQLDLARPAGDEDLLIAAMGAALTCLRAAQPQARLLLVAASEASGLDVGVFLVATDDEWPAPRECGVPDAP